MPYPADLTYQQVAAALRPARTIYPNATTIAEFRPNSLTLHFHHLTREAYAEIARRRTIIADRHPIEVVAHELTHWSDQVSSVWGQDYLVALFDAYDAAESRREEKFFR